MDIKEKNDIFIDNANLQGRMSVFHDKLRKHLSNEYLFLSEKKDNLENEILQLKLEKEQKDKKYGCDIYFTESILGHVLDI